MHGSAMPVCPIILIQRRNILFRPHKAGNGSTAHLVLANESYCSHYNGQRTVARGVPLPNRFGRRNFSLYLMEVSQGPAKNN